MKSNSDSEEQRKLESVLLARAQEEGLLPQGDLARHHELTVTASSTLKLDAAVFCDGTLVAAIEVYATDGPLKSGHQRKMAADLLKLATFFGKARKVMLTNSEKAFLWLTGGSWVAEAARRAGVDVVQVRLTAEETARLREARGNQKRGMSG